MQLSEDTPSTQHLVTAYQEDALWVDDLQYTESIILTPLTIDPWQVTTFELLTEADLALLICDEVELILIGCGALHQQLPTPLLAFFYEKNMGVETMTTKAACRTYNLLANEGRRVVAGLIV